MDDLGNRSGNQTLWDDGTVSFAVDTLTNRYSSVGGDTLTHDDAGNLTGDKDDYTYTYDYENRIVKIEKPDGADAGTDPDPVAEFAYDTQGRRIRVYDAVADAETRFYYSDNWQVLLETDWDSSGLTETDLRLFVYGNYIDEVLRRERYYMDQGQKIGSGPMVMYYLHDHLYSPTVLLDSNGTVWERYEYDAYGKVSIWDPSFSYTYSTSNYSNPYFFTGRRLDTLDSGSCEPMHYRHRAYDTHSGRFMQQDPLGYIDGMNLYEYVKSNSVINYDAYGLMSADSAEWGEICDKYCETKGCYDACYKGLLEKDYSRPLPDVESMLSTLYGKVTFFEKKLPPIPTPCGDIKLSIAGAAKAYPCKGKNKGTATQAEIVIEGEAKMCVGKAVTITPEKMGVPANLGINTKGCPKCKDKIEGSIALGLEASIGVMFKVVSGTHIVLFPRKKTDDLFEYKTKITSDNYMGAELCGVLTAKVKVFRTLGDQ